MKSKNEMKLVIDGKEIDLAKFFEQEKGEEAHEGTGAITDTENDSVDKRALIDEIGGILKGKVDDEIIRTIMEKCEKLSYNGSEDSHSDNEVPQDGDKAPKDDDASKVDTETENGCKAMNYDAVYSKISNALAKQESDKKRAYNAAAKIIGEFNPFGMTEKEILVKALNHMGIATDKESVGEMYAMLKVCNSAAAKVDNGFDYGVAGEDELEINI